ncbi:MAG: hypothetical protein WCE83_06365, partial [Candidatus Baltobacteraceae bacterium]
MAIDRLGLRRGARFVYEYDLNAVWRHEIRIEDRSEPDPRKAYPLCLDGHGACPPEDCGGPAGYLERRDDVLSLDAFEDLDAIADFTVGLFSVQKLTVGGPSNDKGLRAVG